MNNEDESIYGVMFNFEFGSLFIQVDTEKNEKSFLEPVERRRGEINPSVNH